MKLKSLILFSVCSLAACSPKKPAESSSEAAGTKAERIAQVSRIVTRNSPLPSALTDAQFVEEKTGDGSLGPSEFKSFSVLTVAPADLPAWKAALSPLEAQNARPTYVTPKQACPWWMTATDFAGLEFRSCKSLSGRVNGWVGIASDGRIFVYSFTM